MKKIAWNFTAATLLVIIISAFAEVKTLKGTWKFCGGIYNGKKEGATSGYILQRKYGKDQFDAFAIDSGSKPEKYQSGTYQLKGDTCIETETYSSQPSELTGKPIHYLFEVRHDTLILKGKLPTGMTVEEYWKRIK